MIDLISSLIEEQSFLSLNVFFFLVFWFFGCFLLFLGGEGPQSLNFFFFLLSNITFYQSW